MIPKETGERIYPRYFNEAYLDHRNRYYFATNFIKKEDKVLDISCGCGYGSWFMGATTGCKQVVGVDVSDEALNFAQNYYHSEKVIYNKIDISKKFSNLFKEKFNLIISFETIEHLEDDNSYLKELNNLLEDNGLLLISSPNEDIIPYYNNPFFDGGINPYHFRHYTSEEFEKVLIKAGFKVINKYTQENEITKGDNKAVLIFVCKKSDLK